MTVIAQAPAAAVFGYEVADEISKLKSLLQQSVLALTANGVVVPLPGTFPAPGLTSGVNRGGDPISLEKELVNNVMTALAAINAKATLTLLSVTPADVVVLTALVAGNFGNSITVVVGTGTNSGKKITIACPGYVTEIFDDVAATGTAFAAAIQGVSLIVSCVVASGGAARVPVSLVSTPLAGGLGAVVTAPTFSGVALDDGSLQRVNAWGAAIFDSLRTNGYIS